jgi:hypothetical protein
VVAFSDGKPASTPAFAGAGFFQKMLGKSFAQIFAITKTILPQ